MDGSGPPLLLIGDSLSTGVFASFPLGVPPSPEIQAKFLQLIFGNSHSLRVAQSNFSEYHNAATTTDADWGVRQAIGKLHHLQSSDIPLYLAAKWGGRLAHANEFAEKIPELYESKKEPEYILIWLGGNDFCKDHTRDHFEEEYTSLMKKLMKAYPDASFLLVPIPPIYQILAYNYEYSAALSCKKSRKSFCAPIFAKDRVERIEQFNQVISKVADIFSKEVDLVLAEKMASLKLEAADLSFDCFHPSIQGQKKFSSVISAAIKGFKP